MLRSCSPGPVCIKHLWISESFPQLFPVPQRIFLRAVLDHSTEGSLSRIGKTTSTRQNHLVSKERLQKTPTYLNMLLFIYLFIYLFVCLGLEIIITVNYQSLDLTLKVILRQGQFGLLDPSELPFGENCLHCQTYRFR